MTDVSFNAKDIVIFTAIYNFLHILDILTILQNQSSSWIAHLNFEYI